jgi:hypothetical protein
MPPNLFEQRSVGLSIMFNIAQIFGASGIILASAGMARTMSAPNSIRPDCRCPLPLCSTAKTSETEVLARELFVKTEPRDL